LQVPAVLRRSPPLHAGAVQTVCGAKRAQPPMPSHAPVVPQVAAAWTTQILWGSGAPPSTGKQVPPRPCWSQLTHGPLHAMLQQSPSVQNPDLHSPSLPHTAPLGFSPQLPFTHRTPLAQSLFETQVLAHLFVAGSQLYGAQTVAGPDRQRPCSSQTLTSLTAAPLQVPGLQTVPTGNLRHWPWPSQVPSSPQVATAETGQAPERAGAPLATNEQTPGALWSLQVLQVSAQALLQQTPSTQKPLWQSPPHPQG
jgi:hypothetical protein